MQLESFRLYLSKYKFNEPPNTGNSAKSSSQAIKEDEASAKLIPPLYDLFRHKKNDYIDFHELFIGLVVMDPHCKDRCEARLRYIFRHYNGGTAHFSENSLRRMVSDMHAHGKTDYAQVLKQFEVTSPDKLTFHVFYKAVMNNQNIDVSRLLRFDRSILSKASPLFGHLKAVPKSSDRLSSSTKSTDHGQCFCCEKKIYDYGMHAVTIDTAGRCIEPRIINEGINSFECVN